MVYLNVKRLWCILISGEVQCILMSGEVQCILMSGEVVVYFNIRRMSNVS